MVMKGECKHQASLITQSEAQGVSKDIDLELQFITAFFFTISGDRSDIFKIPRPNKVLVENVGNVSLWLLLACIFELINQFKQSLSVKLTISRVQVFHRVPHFALK